MSGIVAYLITAITIGIVHNVITKGTASRELGILTLLLVLGMTNNVMIWIVVISGIVTLMIWRIPEETTTLMIIGVTGLIALIGANTLIIIYLALELVGLTFYILASRERKGTKSTEAGIKYFILGALSSGILLLGMTLAYATTGTTSIELIAGTTDTLASTLIKLGLLFKVGATPFHMWVPDVYEGSPIIVTIYLAVVPKIAYMSVLMRISTGTIDTVLILSGVLSIIVGSIGALNQTKLKRMLAYSAIGHMGFMLIGIGAGTYTSYQATIVYMILYIIMTINSFTMIMELGLQKIVEVRGISRRNGVVGLTMGMGLMSIAGVPPLAGFYNKYLVIRSAVEENLIAVSIIAVIMSVVSSYYYVRIIRWMYFEDAAEVTVIYPRIRTVTSIVLGATTFMILTIMLYPSIIIGIASPMEILI